MMGVARVLGAAFLCAIHVDTVENTLFEDGDGANTLTENEKKNNYCLTTYIHIYRKIS